MPIFLTLFFSSLFFASLVGAAPLVVGMGSHFINETCCFLVLVFFSSGCSFSLEFPLAVLVFYGGLANTVGLVTFPLASVLPVVLISALCCILVKVLISRHYLVSYLSHFCPTSVSTKFRPFYSSLIMTDISYMNNQDPDSTMHRGHVFWTETPKWRPLPEHMHYSDFNLVQGLARMVSCLELFSTLIRPASLSLRLSANISCSHILAVLSSSPAVPFSLFHILSPVLFIFALETLVCFVQCYVFYTLWRMYVGE